METLNDYPAPFINDWGKPNFPKFNLQYLILIKSHFDKQNKLLINTTSTHTFWLQVFNEILNNIESKFSNTQCVHNTVESRYLARR